MTAAPLSELCQVCFWAWRETQTDCKFELCVIAVQGVQNIEMCELNYNTLCFLVIEIAHFGLSSTTKINVMLRLQITTTLDTVIA